MARVVPRVQQSIVEGTDSGQRTAGCGVTRPAVRRQPSDLANPALDARTRAPQKVQYKRQLEKVFTIRKSISVYDPNYLSRLIA